MSFLSGVKSVLTTIGADFKKGLAGLVHYAPIVVADAQKIEQLAQPILQLALPGVAGPIVSVTNTIIGAVFSVEQKFAAMGQQTGTGAQKLAEVLSIVGPVAQQTLTSLGLPADTAAVTNWINVIVNFFNGIPATAPVAPPAS